MALFLHDDWILVHAAVFLTIFRIGYACTRALRVRARPMALFASGTQFSWSII